ncbi:hypothetical protein ABNQ39_22120 [Azospirillum sp. A26]|uniref:hypothetical protein n=1 Tax=Azospirillum sp. A26 TaxID=3160607 RepID=UPI003670D5C6
MPLPEPVNETQRRFAELCRLGGGQKGGPARGKVLELLYESGSTLNRHAHKEVTSMLAEFSEENPWHVCFAIGICWGRLAQLTPEFIAPAVRLLRNWNSEDLKIAKKYHYERGPMPIEESLSGGHSMFKIITPSPELPDSLEKYQKFQQRWLSPILGPSRPKYMGSWNATAMFMVALFSNKDLSAQLVSPLIMLPPGGPVHKGLSILYDCHILSEKPFEKALNDKETDYSSLYHNNTLMEGVLKGRSNWSLLDVHSGLYMLGTRLAESDHWF